MKKAQCHINAIVKVTNEQHSLYGAVGQVETMADASCGVNISGIVNGQEVNGVFTIAYDDIEIN